MLNVERKKIVITTFICFIHISIIYAQGINFEVGLNWQQVKEKAKRENKYIFVDCMATWCGPCKKMDKEVFPSEKVGALFNKSFISIRLQMDTTKQDNEEIRNWYATAETFREQYKVTAYPTYLYFSPNGEIVNKNTGYKKEDEFIYLAKNSLNPDMQYYKLLGNYYKGIKTYATMPRLALSAMNFNDTAVAGIVARDYLINYLYRLNDEQLYTKENISLILTFLNKQKAYFNLFYKNRGKIDKIMGEKSYGQITIDNYIYNETILPFLLDADKSSSNPDWDRIENTARKNYTDDDTRKNMLLSKLRWYAYKVNWNKYGKTAFDLFENYSLSLSAVDFNDFAWNMFVNITDTFLLKAALNWSQRSIDTGQPDFIPAFVDTKANILYKLGRVQEAIPLEEKALLLAREQKQEANVKLFANNIAKMKSGAPTWTGDH